MTARFIDIHLLQTVPYANLNRDDLGSPKTVRFGYSDRTRVSSQAWKRAVREELEERTGDAAKRTRQVPQTVAARLVDRGWAPEPAAFAGQQVMASLATVAVKADGLKIDKKTGAATVLFYLPQRAFDQLAEVCVEHQDALVALQAQGAKAKGAALPGERLLEIVAGRNPVINLFGRMLAELPSTNVDGSVQVAHAFTVHGSDPQVDFFTAVDDITRESEETGSGHMNSAEFAAGTFYRYASVNLADLAKNLDGDHDTALELAEQFLAAFIAALPQAKKNSTAAFTVPELAYISVRSDRPISLASAFEAPVRSRGEGGYAEPARHELADYAERIYRLIGDEGLVHHAHASIDKKPLAGLGEPVAAYRTLIADAIGHARPM